jgi:hypothetical protein
MTAIWRSRDELVHQIVALAADREPKGTGVWALGLRRTRPRPTCSGRACEG